MPTRNRDLSAILPDGNEYEFWEEDCTYTKTLYVDCSNPASSDDNDGSESAPFKTINRAAALAQPGTKVLIRGGYLRVMYPAPELCLDLDTWKEFCGFDKTSDSAWFGFEVKDGKVRLTERRDSPLHAPGPAKPAQVTRDLAKISKRSSVPCVPCDFAGNEHTGDVLPGPFSSWDGEISFTYR